MERQFKLEILNKKIHEYFSEIEKQYNNNCISFGEETILSGGNTTTIAHPCQDAFILKPISGFCKGYTPTQDNAIQVLTRRRISAATFERLLENPNLIKQKLHPTIVGMIKDHVEGIGFDHTKVSAGTYLTFKRPDRDGYFRELEDAAGYEIRCYSNVQNLEGVY